MAVNLSYYDITQVDYAQDLVDGGAILQSGSNLWKPLVLGTKRTNISIGENRLEHRGNLQTLSIDQRVKRWGIFDLQYIAVKYDASAPAFDWWEIINQGFYGGATGAPVIRPGTLWFGVKYNRATPEFWTLSGAKIEQVVITGNMTADAMLVNLRGISRGYKFDTNNYVQGTATRRADPAKVPIVPASDTLLKVDGTDITQYIQSWVLTLTRRYQQRGRSEAATESASQIGLSGQNFREFVPDTFDGRLQLELDPYGTTSEYLIEQLADKALATVELQAQTGAVSNGKQIQFTASRTKEHDQPHEEGRSPSTISLAIDGSTFNVNTL